MRLLYYIILYYINVYICLRLRSCFCLILVLPMHACVYLSVYLCSLLFFILLCALEPIDFAAAPVFVLLLHVIFTPPHITTHNFHLNCNQGRIPEVTGQYGIISKWRRVSNPCSYAYRQIHTDKTQAHTHTHTHSLFLSLSHTYTYTHKHTRTHTRTHARGNTEASKAMHWHAQIGLPSRLWVLFVMLLIGISPNSCVGACPNANSQSSPYAPLLPDINLDPHTVNIY